MGTVVPCTALEAREIETVGGGGGKEEQEGGLVAPLLQEPSIHPPVQETQEPPLYTCVLPH
jgi:hypothetical protein